MAKKHRITIQLAPALVLGPETPHHWPGKVQVTTTSRSQSTELRKRHETLRAASVAHRSKPMSLLIATQTDGRSFLKHQMKPAWPRNFASLAKRGILLATSIPLRSTNLSGAKSIHP